MTTRFIFIRHAKQKQDPKLHAKEWVLTIPGKRKAEKICALPELTEADVLYASDEVKAQMTIQPLAARLGKKIHVSRAFNEIERGKKYLTKDAFAREKQRQLEDLDYPAFNGESGRVALARFKREVCELGRRHAGKTIVVATHGTILTIYFADLLGVLDKLVERWQRAEFGAWGIVEDGRVVKDLLPAAPHGAL